MRLEQKATTLNVQFAALSSILFIIYDNDDESNNNNSSSSNNNNINNNNTQYMNIVPRNRIVFLLRKALTCVPYSTPTC